MKKPNSLKNVATGLTGAVALAAGSEAYGAVVSATLPTDFVPTTGATAATGIPWDVDGDGVTDLEFYFRQTSTTGNWVGGVYGYGGAGVNCAIAYYGTYVVYANRLNVGDTIGPASAFNQNGNYVDVLASRFSGVNYGQFATPNIRGFLGFEFTAGDGMLHYGYIDLSVNRFQTADHGGFHFFSAYYETDANTAITVVPEPGSLAALAFGGALLGGVALSRRKAAAKA